VLPLYPDIKPYRVFELPVDAPHVLYCEESGSPDGIPVLFLHGGPGSGSSHNSRRFFDPDAYRIIVFDQRGAGHSTPHACIDNNTLPDLIKDIDRLLDSLSIDRCFLFGGSWGATLALAYAQARPQRVRGMVLRGVFLCRQRDLDWFYRDGANRVFPDAWDELLAHAPDPNDVLAGYYRELQAENEIERMTAARAWTQWETTCASLRPHPGETKTSTEAHNALAMARLETHYFVNTGFLRENQLLDNAPSLRGIPGIIVHGRYDMVCPLENATSLHQRWPDSELRIIRDGGHSPFEPAMTDALVHATRDMLQWSTDQSA